MAGANVIYGLGMVDLGMTMSYAQLLIDNDIASMINKVVEGIDVTPETLAVDVIKQVGVGGDFLMNEHTMKHMRGVQSQPMLMNRHNRGAWVAAGSKDLAQVANEAAINILENHKPDPLSDSTLSTLSDIVAAAEEEFNKK